MNRTKKLRLISGMLLGTAVIALITLIIVGAVRVNREYPQAQVQMATMDEAVQLGDFEIRATDFHLYTKDEFLQAYPDISPDALEFSMQSGDFRILIPEITVKNTGAQTKMFSTDGTYISTMTWNNGIDVRLLMAMDEEADLYPELAPGEETAILLPCELFQGHVSEREWEQLDQQQFRITFSLYPVIQGIWLTPSI